MNNTIPLISDVRLKLAVTLGLAVLAVLGNVLNVPLFFGVSFIFGSIAVMLAVALLGTVPAVLVAIAGGLYTVMLWGHPYALVIFTVEALVVGLLYRRGLRNLVLADMFYWLVVGVPLVLLFYYGVIGMGWEPAALIALKQPLNGLFNALIAGLLILGMQLTGIGSRCVRLGPARLGSLLFHLLLTAILLAGAAPIIHEGYSLRDQQEVFMSQRLYERARPLAAKLAADRMRWQENLTASDDYPGMGLAILDSEGRVLASQGEVASISDRAGELHKIHDDLSIWLPSGDIPVMPRWKQGRYYVTMDVPGEGGNYRLVIEQAAEPLVNLLEQKGLILFAFLAVLLLLGIVIARFLSHVLTRPLRELERVSGQLSEKIADGMQPLLPVSQVYEYANLGQTLQDMTRHLADSFKALRQAQVGLESQVRERTAELNQFSRTLDRTLDCVFIVDAASLRFIYANEGAMHQVGYSRDELLTMHPFDIKPEFTEAQYRALVEQLISGEQETLTFETVHQHKDGHRVPVEVFLQYIPQGDGPARFVNMVRDISERKAAEMALRESEQRFRNMLENCPTAARIAKAGGHDIFFSNRRYAELINATPDQVDGLDPETYYAHPEDYYEILQCLQKGEPIMDRLVELRIPGSGIKWALASYFPIQYQDESAVLGWFYDITDRKQAETALQEQAQHTRAILDNMVDGIITIDQLGSVASFNPAAEKIFGYASDEVLGQNIKMLMPNPYRDAHDGYLQNYQATGVARIIGIGREVEGLRKDGSRFPMDLAISEVTREGHPMYVGMVRDITERKRVDRMKSEFVSTVSHELRTPLTSISGALGLLGGGALGELSPQAREMIGIAQKNSQRLSHLINDLLDMEKIAAGKLHFDMQSQPLMPLLEQALEANRAYGVEREIQLVLSGNVPDIVVRVDAQRLIQVLSNLLSNAIKYSPQAGTVEVAARLQGRNVRVSVTDGGTGIPAAFRSRIFEKFAQADSSDTRQKGGTGLGLAITRELVERMGGTIAFESVEGEGATFFFELPLAQAQTPADYFNPDIPLEPGASRILVVDDEPEVAHLLGLVLSRAGYAVETALNGSQALEALNRSRFDAMTLDLMLPDIGGLEIIRQVHQRRETENLPIIVVSAKMEEGRLSISGDFSGIDWLAKPINESFLLSVVERQLSKLDVPRPRVLHVEDDQDLHRIVREMVGDRFDFELATTLQEAKARVALERFDVVILDLSLPDGSGWDLLPDIRARQPDARIVILSGAEMTTEQTRKVEAVLLKSRVSPRELLDALRNRIQSS